MKIVVNAFWDEEAQVWAAQAEGKIGLFAEAPTVEALWNKLPIIARDLLEGTYEGELDIELRTRIHQVIAAE